MSSTGSPTLIIDVRGRRAESVFAALTIALGAAAPWLIDAASPAFAALCTVCCGGALAWTFRRQGWLGGRRRIVRVSWTSEGRWILTEAAGHGVECVLDPGTRVARALVWLRWRLEENPSVRRSLLLTAGDATSSDMRRLIVRLRSDAARAFAARGVVAA